MITGDGEPKSDNDQGDWINYQPQLVQDFLFLPLAVCSEYVVSGVEATRDNPLDVPCLAPKESPQKKNTGFDLDEVFESGFQTLF